MAAQSKQERLHGELLERYGPKVADAFIEAVSDLATAADLQRLIIAIQHGNLGEAIEALHLDPAAFAGLQDAIREAYLAGGDGAVGLLPRMVDQAGNAVVLRFNARNVAAEQWLSTHSADMVTRILGQQRAAVQAALTDRMARGDNPRAAALDIVGRMNPKTQAREGGILGLTGPQEEFVRNARDELESGDPAKLKAYLARSRRDKRFDPSIRKAIRDGSPVPADTVDRALVGYKRRLLQLRGETVGRVETMTALQKAKNEAHRQAVESGKVPVGAVSKRWSSSRDLDVRHTHSVLDGQVVPLDQPFVSPSGAQMMHPMDRSLGAPAEEIVGCRCDTVYKIRWPLTR